MNLSNSIDNRYLSANDLALRFGVSKDTVWRWKRVGNLPKAVKISSGTTRWRLSDIVDYENNMSACFATHLINPKPAPDCCKMDYSLDEETSNNTLFIK